VNSTTKRDVADQLLEKGSIFIHMDPRREKVQCPPWLKSSPRLVLQVGLDMAIPIPDLRIDDEGIFGTLSFSCTPIRCFCPWEAIFALVSDDGVGQMWPESMPAEVVAEIERERSQEIRAAAVAPRAASSPRLKARPKRALPAGWRVVK